MGSFSWNRADDLGEVENIYGECAFKFLIPKEFGGGFIRDKYQDYGHLGRRENVGKYDIEHKYDIYEILAFWNHVDVKPRSTKSVERPMDLSVGAEVTIEIDDYERSEVTPEAFALRGKKFTITEVVNTEVPKSVLIKNPYRMPCGFRLSGEAADCGLWERRFFKNTTWYEPLPAEGLKYDGDVMPLMPEISRYTDHNRTLGIYLFHEEVEAERERREKGLEDAGGVNYGGKEFDRGSYQVDQGDFMKYPPKLVSIGFKGTYEDCKSFSQHDPDQGFFARKRGEGRRY